MQQFKLATTVGLLLLCQDVVMYISKTTRPNH